MRTHFRMMADLVEVPETNTIADNPVYCGSCMNEMNNMEDNIFKCPTCGIIYNYHTI